MYKIILISHKIIFALEELSRVCANDLDDATVMSSGLSLLWIGDYKRAKCSFHYKLDSLVLEDESEDLRGELMSFMCNASQKHYREPSLTKTIWPHSL